MFPYIKQPRTILRNSNHSFYDGSGKIISFNQAKSLLESETRFVIKPAIYSGEGIDIFFYEKDDCHDMDFQIMMESYGSDYIVQEVITQHEVLANIHPSSLNTIRVISFCSVAKFIFLHHSRMGVEGSRQQCFCRRDCLSVKSDGRLEAGIDKLSRWTERHPVELFSVR